MKLNEIIVENFFSDTANALRTGLYKATGLGGTKANEIAFQQQFLKTFNQQAKLAIQSAAKAGVTPSEKEFEKIANNYMSKYKWQADSDQIAQLKNLSKLVATEPSNTNINKLGNYLYYIGRQQQPQQSQQRQEPTLGGETNLGSSSKVIIQQIEKLTGSGNYDDLEQIAKSAMQLLYKQNPASYTKLYKEIISAGNKGVGDVDDNPNIVRGYNESRQK